VCSSDLDGDLPGLSEGDVVTVSFDGNSYDFTLLASDTLENFVNNLQNILGTRALVTLTGDGRIGIQNLETSQILDFSISTQSATGEQRTLFNQVFSELPSTIPGLTSVITHRMFDLGRYLRLGDEDLALSDNDQQNILEYVATVGARANRLTTITNLFTASQLNVEGLRNSIEAANYAELVTYLNQQQLILQSSMGVGAKILPPSLIDFLV
jgi:flagellin-like hook-associated protein FlgL